MLEFCFKMSMFEILKFCLICSRILSWKVYVETVCTAFLNHHHCTKQAIVYNTVYFLTNCNFDFVQKICYFVKKFIFPNHFFILSVVSQPFTLPTLFSCSDGEISSKSNCSTVNFHLGLHGLFI